MAAIAATVGVPESTFIGGMTWGGPFWDSAATAWKYGASRTSGVLLLGSHGSSAHVDCCALTAGHVYGTPTYMVNGVPVEADGTWTVKQWQALLNPLVDAKEL